MKHLDLMQLAEQARNNAYAPYSGYTVGAALFTGSGAVYTGCNIENASYSATMCAERVALFQAIAAGECAFTMLAIAGGERGEKSGFCPPCGVCLQTLSEFLEKNCTILLLNEKSEICTYAFRDLLPYNFAKEHLKKGENEV